MKYIETLRISCYIYGCHSRASWYFLLRWLRFLLTDSLLLLRCNLFSPQHPESSFENMADLSCAHSESFSDCSLHRERNQISLSGSYGSTTPSPTNPPLHSSLNDLLLLLASWALNQNRLRQIFHPWSIVPRCLHSNSLRCFRPLLKNCSRDIHPPSKVWLCFTSSFWLLTACLCLCCIFPHSP